MPTDAIAADQTSVFPRFLDLAYPSIERGEGAWLHTSDGRAILDACSGGAMVACVGHGVRPLIDAAAEQAARISYVYNHHFSNEPQERLARALLERVAPQMARVRFTTGGSEANETALRLARSYHVERGDAERWRVISPAQAYHGATMGTLGLTGRASLQAPYDPYLSTHLHVAPATRRTDPGGAAALAELDRVIEQAGAETIAAFFCEPVSAAALPAYAPPRAFWEGLAERRERHGFLIVLDEIVTGMGRTGRWLAAEALPFEPDIVTAGKGLGCGYAPLGAVLCGEHVYDALAAGSREFDLGHTWDGAPLPCAVGLAALDYLEEHRLVERVARLGPQLREDLIEALAGLPLVGEVRGEGFLLGIELVDPRDGRSPLPPALHAPDLVDDIAFDHGLLVTSSHAARDGYAPDQTLLAPAFTLTEAELAELVERLRATLVAVEAEVERALRAGAA